MNVTDRKPDNLEDDYPFIDSYEVLYYLYTEDITGHRKAAYYIVRNDGITGLYNKRGDFLYDVGSLDPGHVCEMIVTDKSFYNWRNYERPRLQFNTREPLRGEGWARECIRLCAGSIVLWLTRYHPKRTYREAEAIILNEGYRINEKGFLEPVVK